MLGGTRLSSPHGLDDLAAAETVIVPSVSDPAAATSPELVAAPRRAHRRSARLVSICSGAFALAATGLLDGRRATTHWRYADQLRRRFPAVDPAPLFVDGGDVLTSAGCASPVPEAPPRRRRETCRTFLDGAIAPWSPRIASCSHAVPSIYVLSWRRCVASCSVRRRADVNPLPCATSRPAGVVTLHRRDERFRSRP